MNEMMLMKTPDGSFRPVTQDDMALASGWKTGQGIRVKAVQVKPRSIDHHRLYWGGLLELALEYWEPKGGLISSSEKHTLKQFSNWLDMKSGKTGAIENACKVFLAELRDSRGQKIQVPEKNKADLHTWVKVEAGYFDYVLTPIGIRKEAKSINFNAMDQDEFNDFYKSAFAVVWNFILSRHFENEDAASDSVNQLLAMG